MTIHGFYLYALIALAGGLGSVIRYLMTIFMPANTQYLTGVFFVNIIGAFMMGIIIHTQFSTNMKLVLASGFIGGLTTFSTMMMQGNQQEKRYQRAIYFVLQVIFGLIMFYLGVLLSHLLKL